MAVYADVLVALNLLVNYFLLLVSDKILKTDTKIWRLILSAFVGAVSSLYIFLPQMSFFLEIGFKISVCIIMSLIAFIPKRPKQFLRAVGVLFLITCSYAGVMMAVWHIFKPNGMVIYNSVVYFNISPIVLVVSSSVAYFAFIFLRYVFKLSSQTAETCSIRIELGEKKIDLKAIIDTGNSITDVFGESEVIITDKQEIKKLLGSKNLFENGDVKPRYRAIPCSTVYGTGVLEGVRCDRAVVVNNGKTSVIKKPILAVSNTPLNDGYNAIVNPRILDRAGNYCEN